MAKQMIDREKGDGLAGERIRRLRISQGYSQAELAHMVDVNQRTLVRWECGEVEPRLGPKLRNLAGCLRVKAGFILYGEEDMNGKH